MDYRKALVSYLTQLACSNPHVAKNLSWRASFGLYFPPSQSGSPQKVSRRQEERESDLAAALLKADCPALNGLPEEKLRPIFCDRYDLEAGHSLREQIIDALNFSEALIVICSPASATSPYVNEEIRLFKATGRSSRIYPIIVEGEPGDSVLECFSINLRRKVGTDGVVTDETEEPIAADMREHGDGEDLAKLKLIAGLLGVDIDELRRREESERRRRQRRLAAVAALMTVLATLAVGFAGYSQVLNSRLKTRYEQALTSTLRLVTIAATFRSLTDGTIIQGHPDT